MFAVLNFEQLSSRSKSWLRPTKTVKESDTSDVIFGHDFGITKSGSGEIVNTCGNICNTKMAKIVGSTIKDYS